MSRTFGELADRRLRVKDMARIHLLECETKMLAVPPSGHKVFINDVFGLDEGLPLSQNPSQLIRPNKFCFPLLVNIVPR